MDPFLKLIAAYREEYSSPTYRWRNDGRNGGRQWVFQRTVKGRCTLKRPEGNCLDVMEGEVMVFQHSDGSEYGYPEDFDGTYALAFVAMEGELADAICAKSFRSGGDVCSMDRLGAASGIFDDIVDRFSNRSFQDSLEMSELLYRFLIAMKREKDGMGRKGDPVAYCRAAIKLRHVTPITIGGLANEVGMSREHLSRVFGQRYGESPGTLLRRLRLERGRAMLLGSSLDVETVALACGYSASDSFGRAFKEQFGLGPRAFRAEARR